MSIYLDTELCKGCKICVNICPKDVYDLNKEVNQKGYNYVEAVNPDACIRCKLCEKSCPDFVIHIE